MVQVRSCDPDFVGSNPALHLDYEAIGRKAPKSRIECSMVIRAEYEPIAGIIAPRRALRSQVSGIQHLRASNVAYGAYGAITSKRVKHETLLIWAISDLL